MQQHRPLLLDSRVCAVYLEHDVLERSWRSPRSLEAIYERASSVSTP